MARSANKKNGKKKKTGGGKSKTKSTAQQKKGTAKSTAQQNSNLPSASKLMDQLPAGSMDMLSGLLDRGADGTQGRNMFASAAARTAQSLGPDHKSFAPLDDTEMDRLWERLNSEEARTDEDFEIWPDLAEAKCLKNTSSATTTTSASAATVVDDFKDAVVKDAYIDIADYDSDEELDLEDIRFPHTPMPAISERSMDDVLGTASTEDGTPSLLARMLDPDSGGKGANKNGLRGLLPQKKKPELTVKQKFRERRLALARLRQGMTREDYVYDARGRRVKGARQFSMEDIQSGAVPRSMLQHVDKKAMREQIKRNIAKEREKMAAAQKEKEQTLSIVDTASAEDNR